MANTITEITRTKIEERLKQKIAVLYTQPEFRWGTRLDTDDGERINFTQDTDGSPAVRVGVADCSLDFDIWKGLRNPALVGLYPAGFEEIWSYYALNRKRKTDETGRATIFQIAEPFEKAVSRFGRAVVISAMLPMDPSVYREYMDAVETDPSAPWEGYCKAWAELNTLLDKGVNRLAYDLIRKDRAVIVMNDKNVTRISEQTLPVTRQGTSHGVSKGGNYSQKSVAVLTGLGQFGVSRIVFRDEQEGDGVRRMMGTLRSIIVFDAESPSDGNRDGVLNLTDEWLGTVKRISDFTASDEELNATRFCTYQGSGDEPGCTACVSMCPSGAIRSSAPGADGAYNDRIAGQTHRFWDGALQFDNGKCCDQRGQLGVLYDEWMCGRCVASCAAHGIARSGAAREFTKVVDNGGIT